jgi:hypothetical protein
MELKIITLSNLSGAVKDALDESENLDKKEDLDRELVW